MSKIVLELYDLKKGDYPIQDSTAMGFHERWNVFVRVKINSDGLFTDASSSPSNSEQTYPIDEMHIWFSEWIFAEMPKDFETSTLIQTEIKEDTLTAMKRGIEYYYEGKNQVFIAVCENEQRRRLFERFNSMFPHIKTAYVDSNESYSTFETSDTVFFVNCIEDFARRYFVIKSIPNNTIIFLVDRNEQQKYLFNSGELHRNLSFDFTDFDDEVFGGNVKKSL